MVSHTGRVVDQEMMEVGSRRQTGFRPDKRDQTGFPLQIMRGETCKLKKTSCSFRYFAFLYRNLWYIVIIIEMDSVDEFKHKCLQCVYH